MRLLEQIINSRPNLSTLVVFTAEESQHTRGKSFWLMNVDIEKLLDIFGSADAVVNMMSYLVKMIIVIKTHSRASGLSVTFSEFRWKYFIRQIHKKFLQNRRSLMSDFSRPQ